MKTTSLGTFVVISIVYRRGGIETYNPVSTYQLLTVFLLSTAEAVLRQLDAYHPPLLCISIVYR